MRISPKEKRCLVEASKLSFGPQTKIWLFGSRADDGAHGGDIDLYVEVEPQGNIFEAKLKFFDLVYPVFGEQKIDLITHDTTRALSAFHRYAKKTGVLLV